MRLGYTVWYGNRPFYAFIKACSELGYSYVELSLDYPWFVEFDKFVDELLRAKRELGIEFAVHAPWREIYLASPYEPVRELSVETVSKVIRDASVLDPIYVVVHIATMESLDFEEVRARAKASAVKSLKELKKVASEVGTELYAENAGHPRLIRQETYAEIISEAGVEPLIDIVQAVMLYIRSGADPYAVIKDFLDAVEWRVHAFHAHNIVTSRQGKPLIHVALDEGELDYSKVMEILKKTINKSTTITLEVFKHANGKNITLPETAKSIEVIVNSVKARKKT